MSKRSANMRRNGEYFHVVSPGRDTTWTGRSAVNIPTGEECSVIPVATREEADTTAAMMVGEGYARWAAVMDRGQVPVSLARDSSGQVHVYSAIDYGFSAHELYQRLDRGGRITPKQERYRSLMAQGRMTREEEFAYTTALVNTAVAYAGSRESQDGRWFAPIDLDALPMGFIGRVERYHETPRGYVPYSEDRSTVMEVIFEAYAEPALRVDVSTWVQVGHALDKTTKDAFARLWNKLLFLR